jgi:hypothetical protein
MSPSFRPEPERGHRWFGRFAVVFVLVAGGAVAVAWSAVGAAAEVVVLSEPAELPVRLELTIGTEPGQVAGKVVRLAETVSGTYPTSAVAGATTSVSAAPVRAQGKVRITNAYSKAQPLVVRTRVATADNKVFRITAPVTVPAGGNVTANVVADALGPEQAIANGAELIIPGLNADTRRFFTVIAIGDFTTVAETAASAAAASPAPSAQVTSAAAEAAAAELEGKVDLTLATKANAEGAGYTAAGTTFAFTTAQRAFSPAVGQPASEFTATIERDATAVFYDRAALDREVARAVADQVPFGRVLGRVVSEATKVTVGTVNAAAKTATVVVIGTALTTVSATAPALDKAQFAGITPDAAKKYVERIDGVASASVRIRPFWLGSLPKDPSRITVEVR